MFTETQLHFFQEKIAGIETGLLINQSMSVLKLPNRIIRVSHVDDVGQIWFFVPRPIQHLTEFEREFPVKLLFSRKDAAYYFHIEGKVHMMIDPEEVNELDYLPANMKERAMKEDLLLKLKVSKVFYRKRKLKPLHVPKESWSTGFQRLLQTQRLIFNQLLVKLHF